MRIPFDIKYRPEIESGKYKVVTEFGEPVRIICWDSKYHSDLPIIALIDDGDGEDMIHLSANGKYEIDSKRGFTHLLIITDEPEELTEFEKAVEEIYESFGVKQLKVKEKAAKLLAIANRELEKSQWIKDMQEWWYNKGHTEGYWKGQKEAEERHNEANSYHMPIIPPTGYPPCYWGGPCTNPQHDCVNCPHQGASGVFKTNTKIE